jgi:hypothetical protein
MFRLGATGNDAGLLTALPALAAFPLAIPLGRWLQGGIPAILAIWATNRG